MHSAQKKDFLITLAYAASLLALAYLFFRYLFWWLLPFFLAFAAAAAMEPAIRFLQRRFHFQRGFSAAVLTLFLLFLLGGLLSLLLSSLFSEAESFLTLAPRVLGALPEYTAQLTAQLEAYCALCPEWLQAFLTEQLSDFSARLGELLSALLGRLLSALAALAASLPRFLLAGATTVLAVFFLSSSYPALLAAARERLPREARKRVLLWRGCLTRSIGRWLRAQAALCFLTFCQLLLGFFLLRERYALLAAFLITLVDALPVFGTGTVLIPWALVKLLAGRVPRAAALLALYLCTLTVRNIMEPRLMAAQAGLPPIASLAAMYLGFCSFGVAGMVLFPFFLLLASQLRHAKKEGSI